MAAPSPLPTWHKMLQDKNPSTVVATLSSIIREDAVFHSPVVFAPQKGKDLVIKYLTAAIYVLSPGGFHYEREIVEGKNACLEFVTEVDGVVINGVDLIRWDEKGMIVDFKVMIRPLKAIDKVKAKMAALLQAKPKL